MALDGCAAGAEDVLAAALIERPSDQQAAESKKRSRRPPGPPAPKCTNCGKKPQRRCEHQLCAKCCGGLWKQCSIHSSSGSQQTRVNSLRDLTQAHGIYQQEAEESRLWYQWVFEQSQVSESEALGQALKRYRLNSQLLASLMDGTGLEENQQDLVTTTKSLQAEVKAFVEAHPSSSDNMDDNSGVSDNLAGATLDVSDIQESLSTSSQPVPIIMSEAEHGILEDLTKIEQIIQL